VQRIDVFDFKLINEDSDMPLAHFNINDEDEYVFDTIFPGDLLLKREEGEDIKLKNCTTYSYGDWGKNLENHRIQVFYDGLERLNSCQIE